LKTEAERNEALKKIGSKAVDFFRVPLHDTHPDSIRRTAGEINYKADQEKAQNANEAVQVEDHTKNVLTSKLKDPKVHAPLIKDATKDMPEGKEKEVVEQEAKLLFENPDLMLELTRQKQARKQPLSPAEAIALGISTLGMPLLGGLLGGDEGFIVGAEQGMHNLKAYSDAQKAREELDRKDRELDIKEREAGLNFAFKKANFDLAKRNSDFKIAQFKAGLGSKKGAGLKQAQADAFTHGRSVRNGLVNVRKSLDAFLKEGEGFWGGFGRVGRNILAAGGEAGGIGGGRFRSEAEQLFNQGMGEISNALLRFESGAAIGAKEMASKIEQLRPQSGESIALVIQKLQTIELMADSLEQVSGVELQTKEEKRATFNFIQGLADSVAKGANVQFNKQYKNFKGDKKDAMRTYIRRQVNARQ
jgi:hypothetical protein